jgi:hypothetical protein
MERFTLADNVGTAKWNDLPLPTMSERPNGTIYSRRQCRNSQMERFTLA